MSREEERIAEIKDNYREAVQGWQHVYDAATDDIRFVYDVDSGQWPDHIRNQREKDGRPILTINKLQKTLRRIRGDHKLNPASIRVLPVDDKADIQIAELYNGLIREIEYLSRADIAYDTAYNHALSGSVGFFRIVTQWAEGDSFEQDIRIRRVANPMSVHFDPFAQEFCLEDARYCFIEDMVDKKRFKKLYPKAEFHDFDSSRTSTLFGDWMTTDKVRIAEYFYKERVKRKIVELEDGTVIPVEKKITMDALKEMGAAVKREREADAEVVKWVKMTGAEILEEGEWPTPDIPVIPVFGDEVVVEGKRYYISLARGAKDPQRMYNYWATSGTETVALAPKMPFIVDHRQLKNFENEWDEANLTNRMYIRYNAIAGLQKPSREPQTQVPTAIMGMMQATAYDVEDHLGQYEASKGEAGNERSKVAIMARVQQSDKGTYLFVDNATRSHVAAGRQLIRLIPKVYDTQRALRVRGEDGQEQLVSVNQPALMPNGQVGRLNDLTVGRYDLIATVGASYSSKRQEMMEMMVQAMQYAPMLANAIAPLIFKYADFPGAQEIAQVLQQQAQVLQQQQQMQLQIKGAIPSGTGPMQ